MNTDPKYYNLNARTKLQVISENELAIVKLIKSRIIRKDAEKIVLQVKQIKAKAPHLVVSLLCTDNICSKSLALLKKEGISIHFSNMC